VLVWGTVLLLVEYFEFWGGFTKIWLVPMLIAGMFQTARKFTEHLGMSSFDPLLGTRTVLGTNWLTRFCTFANFDIFIHGPHHRHPRIPHRQLGRKMGDYLAANPAICYPIYASYWQALWSTVPFFLFNPGCGVNAGNSAAERQDDDIQDFVA
jgi:fatty acid desaturase